MSITSLTLTNPGAESGNTTGWTLRTGHNFFATTSQGGKTPHSGTYFFYPGDGNAGTISLCEFDQEVDVSSFATAIDNNTCAAKAYAWHNGDGGTDTGAL